MSTHIMHPFIKKRAITREMGKNQQELGKEIWLNRSIVETRKNT